MLADIDLDSPEDLERLRRSIAMLGPGQQALNREEALRLLDQIAQRVKSR